MATMVDTTAVYCGERPRSFASAQAREILHTAKDEDISYGPANKPKGGQYFFDFYWRR